MNAPTRPTAPANPWVQTASGRAFDLVEPRAGMIDFDIDIAEALARTPRFNGHTRSGAYSVAQHSVLGATALLEKTHRADFAAAFLLHDAHEAYIGDIATPVAHALHAIAGQLSSNGLVAECVRNTLTTLKARIDAAIHEAAGLAWPLPADVARAVKDMDLRMLAAERLQLLGPSPARWDAAVEKAEPAVLRGKIRIWPWPDAADQYRLALRTFFPTLKL